jgi:DNA-binding NarL/FixJ family response regulator
MKPSKEAGMENRRVALLCSDHLLGESLERLLSNVEGVELAGHWGLEELAAAQRSLQLPDIVLIADGELQPQNAYRLTAQVLQDYPDLPVIQVNLVHNYARVYCSYKLLARTYDLIDAIRKLPIRPRVDQKLGCRE